MRKKLVIIVLVILTAISFQIFRVLNAAGSFKDISPSKVGESKVLNGMVGAEDLTIDHSIKKAIVAADDRRGHRNGKTGNGAVYLLDYLSEAPSFINLTAGLGLTDFHPHGLSLYQHQADNTKWVFVVNHRRDGHFIEIFQFTDSTLVHSESISNEKIISPNDVVGIGKRSFYFTNDHDESGGFSQWKDFMMIGTAQVGYFDGTDVEIIDDGLGYANGINLSNDGKHILVATTTDRQVVVYNRATHELEGKVDCYTGLDNIELDENGSLWIGSHPKLLVFLDHAKDAAKRSPSQAIKVDLDYSDFSKSTVTEIYLNDGDPLSGLSVAVMTDNVLLLGTVFEDGVLIMKNDE